MTTNYPTSLDTVSVLKNNSDDPTISSVTHPTAHNNAADAIKAIETELGVLPKGTYSSVVDRLNNIASQSPGASQIVQPTGNFIPMVIKANAAQSVARLFEIQSSGGSTLGFWNKTGVLNAASFKIAGTALASTHLSDTSSILRNSSPSITTPSMSSPTFTGTPVAPTAAPDTNTTQVATTAFVKTQAYAPINSPTFTGVPTAPTPSVGDNSTKIATTAYVVAEIADRTVSSEPIGTITAYAGSSAPTDWMICDGAAISQATYPDLYALIGVTYGDPGGGNFNLPDARGRMIVGLGTHTDVDALGENDGVAVGTRRPKHSHSTSLSSTQGGHSHGGSTSSSDGSHTHGYTGPSGSRTDSGGGISSATGTGGSSTGGGGSHTHSISFNTGGSHDHTIGGSVGMTSLAPADQPAYLTVNYIIKVEQS